ncbi:hypothetical protein PENTCL1PPCAC_12464, partial [Pristionchus entomophagus]
EKLYLVMLTSVVSLVTSELHFLVEHFPTVRTMERLHFVDYALMIEEKGRRCEAFRAFTDSAFVRTFPCMKAHMNCQSNLSSAERADVTRKFLIRLQILSFVFNTIMGGETF